MKILENLPLFASSAACKAIKAILLWQRLHLESTMTTFPPPVRDYFLRSLWLSQRRHILNFNLALFILFGFIFSASGLPHFKRTLSENGAGKRETDKNHARHYPAPKLLRLLCFMGNAITFIQFLVKIYFSAFSPFKP